MSIRSPWIGLLLLCCCWAPPLGYSLPVCPAAQRDLAASSTGPSVSSIESLSSSTAFSSTGVGSLSSSNAFSSSSSFDDVEFFHSGVTYATDSFSFAPIGEGVLIPTRMNTTGVEHGWLNIPGFPQDDVNQPYGYPMDTAVNAAGTALPIGITSAVPLGGVGTGNYEVRADGKMYHSTIRNQDMAGEPWQGTVRDFLMVVTLNGVPYSIQIGTTFAGLTPVPQLVYQGLFPLSKLSFLGMSLYMYSAITPVDLETSNTPAVAFALHYTNQGSSPVSVSFAITMPFGLRNDWTQVGTSASAITPATPSAAGCAQACKATASCHAWQFNRATQQCLSDSVYTQGYNLAGVDSGHPGAWSLSTNSISFQHSVIGTPYNGLGQQVLYSPQQPASVWTTDAVGSNFKTGSLFGVLSVTAEALPNVPVELIIVHGWYFPTHYWARDQGGSDLGNWYTRQFTDALDAARSMDHGAIANNLVLWQSAYSGLPNDIQDYVFNVFSHARSAMYFKDGSWMQWEGYGFTDTDSVHNDAERRVQYFNFFPSTERTKILKWATIQLANGMIQEQFGAGEGLTVNPYVPEGRTMADVTQMYVCLVLEHVILHNDSALLQQLYTPTLVPALNWMMAQAAQSPWSVPTGLTETYDVELEGIYGASLYSYTMYAAGLKCGEKAAHYMNDSAMAATINTAFLLAQQGVEDHLWMNGYYTAETTGTQHIYDQMQGLPIRSADGLHGQIEAYRLNLGDLLDIDRMKSHLVNALGYLQTPFGMEFNKNLARHYNWVMADHSVTALMLWWNEPDAWNQTLQQVRHSRDDKADLWRTPAVYETNYGGNWLLNFYGWNKWTEQSLQAFSGQHTNLYEGWLSLAPHSSAFSGGAAARVPLLWGGYVGYLSLDGLSATLTTVFAEKTFVLKTVTICGSIFHSVTLQVGANWTASLSSLCPSMTANTSIPEPSCVLTNVGNYQIGGLPVANSQAMDLEQCTQSALSSQALCMISIPIWPGGGACLFVGSPCCYIGFDPTACATVGPAYPASYGNVVSARVSCPASSCTQASTLQNYAFDPNAFSLTIASLIMVQPLTSAALCQAQAIQYGVCGWVWYAQSPVTQQDCTAGSPCCFLNAYRDCMATPAVPYSGTEGSTLGYLHC